METEKKDRAEKGQGRAVTYFENLMAQCQVPFQHVHKYVKLYRQKKSVQDESLMTTISRPVYIGKAQQ